MSRFSPRSIQEIAESLTATPAVLDAFAAAAAEQFGETDLLTAAEAAAAYAPKAATSLTALTSADSATGDLIYIYDVSTATLKKMTRAEMLLMVGGGAPAETILVAGAISPANAVSYLSGASGSYAVTLAAPDASMVGKTKLIEYTVGAGVVTLNATNIDDTGDVSPTLDNTFSVVGQTIVLLGLSNKWLLIEQSHTA